MKDKQLRAKAWLYSKGLKEAFTGVGDQQGAQLFETIKLILQRDELCLSRFLHAMLQFVKAESVNTPSDN